MRRAFILFFILVVLVSCNSMNSLKLTEEEASTIIIKKNGYPKPIYIDIEITGDFYPERERLVNEGYLTINEFSNYSITEKGRKLIKSYYNTFRGVDKFALFTHNLDIYSITKISVNSKNKTAVVNYSVGYFPTDYFNHLSQINKKIMEEASRSLSGNSILRSSSRRLYC